MRTVELHSNNLIDPVSTAQGSQAAPALADTLANRTQGALDTLRLWRRRMRERSELRKLLERDHRFFSDIGVPWGTVRIESGKWFWQE